jgi:hypothetical protein
MTMRIPTEISAFLRSENTWFRVDSINSESVSLITREHGDVGRQKIGKEDLQEAKRLKVLYLQKFPTGSAEIDYMDEWVVLELFYPQGIRTAQKAPPKVAPSAEGAFYKAPQFSEVREFAETGAITNSPEIAAEAASKDNLDLSKRKTVSDAKQAPPTPEEIKKGPGGKAVSTLNRLVVDSVDPKAEKAVPANEEKMPKLSALEINNSRMKSWLRQVSSR